jgi:membrane protein
MPETLPPNTAPRLAEPLPKTATKLSASIASAPKRFISWRLGGLTHKQLAIRVYSEVNSHNTLGRASELAFNFLFALFPLILFMLSLFGLFASRSVELQVAFLSYFADILPPAAFQLLNNTTIELATHTSRGLLTFSIIMALVFASGGVNSMIDALNDAYHVEETRSYIKVRLIALALTLAIAILLLASLLVLLASTRVVNWLGNEMHLQPVLVVVWKTLQWPAAIFFVLLSYSLIYFFGADLKVRHWHWLAPGSVFGAGMWLLTSFAFRGYLHFFNSYSSSYGSLGAVMILLAWLYVTGLAFLIGGEINAQIDRATVAKRSNMEQE